MKNLRTFLKLKNTLYKLRKIFRLKSLFLGLVCLSFIKLFILFTFLGTYVYHLEAKQQDLPSGCPPEFAEFLKIEKNRIYEKEKELELKEKELRLLDARIQEQLNALKELQASVEEKLSRIEAIREERINLLVKAISEMKPSKAAEMLVNMDKDMAVKVLSRLKSTQIASILSAMPPEKAAALSEALTGYPSKE